MACLAFGRGATQQAQAEHGAAAAERGDSQSGVAGSSPDAEAQMRQLSVADDPARILAESAVFDAIAQQITAFICNLDEATVNCGASELARAGAQGGATWDWPAGSSPGGSKQSGRGGSTAGGSSGLPPSSGNASLASSRSSSLARSGGSAVISAHVVGSSGSSSKGGRGGDGGAALFRRLSAANDDSGFGWRERRAAFEAAMLRENRVERLVGRADPQAAEKRLQHRLLVARLEAVAFRGCSAGNALFDALSLALWGTPTHGRCLRALAVEHAARHPAEYRCFLGDDWEAYLSGMSQPGTPGDELMLRAACDRFGVPANIVTSDAFMWFQRYAPLKTRSRREVTLAFVGPNMWMPVRRQSTITTLRLSLSGSSEWRQAREMRRRMTQMELQPGTPR